ncbi:conserved hypothetical protein [Cryptococcus gattii WM276]|uniref:E3 ubiquitin-protein ligase NRDP1 n=1 Tax=Cryptococcus gattii serotype B (strain WM276 / ATCC MYA-4071) TaxID=367775 RepID=E6RB25_CRYGW|nr:uncharacterized protein CGB_H4040W [Cryptococcus gattii WM276]ADV24027.1 conserved hypothetical protein [Cryptococcus gattii WM276]KJE03920.1 E3 ubiquitin-protein ligase NRDP1 [Cryptococcus gattii NT-10]
MAHEITYDYVEHVDPNLTWVICQSAIIDPVTTTSCKHTFCRDCITQAISHNPQCPIDRSALTMSSIRDTEQLVKLMLDELKVKCGAKGCGMVLQRGLLLAHLRTCPKAIVTCQDGDWGLSMTRQKMPHHRAYECFLRKMECTKCGTLLVFKDQTVHTNTECRDETEGHCALCYQNMGADAHTHKWRCPQVCIPCPHSGKGCSSIIPRSDLQAHLSTCPFEAFSGFFEMNDARLKSLTSRAERLEEELESMREHLKRMEGNVEALGHMRRETGDDWRWREAGRMPLGDTPSPVISSNDNLNSQIPLIFSSSPSTLTPSQASAQPAISSVPPSISVLSSGGARPDLSHHHQRFLVVPPRNAGNLGWEEVTNGLKARIHRRTMRESLRVLEEVGSLRAVVTTMHMQVMMERRSRPSSFQFHRESLFSRVTEPNLAPPLNQQTPMASPSTTDQSTAEQRSQLCGESPSASGDQEYSGRETGSITESVVFSAQVHPSSSSQSPSSTSSLITAGEGSSGSKRNSMSQARSSLGGYQGVTGEVRYDEDGDGIGGGPSCNRRNSGTRGDRNTTGRSGAGMTGRPMAFPPASQEDGETPMTTSRDMGGDVDGATGRSMGIRKRRGPPGSGSPRL